MELSSLPRTLAERITPHPQTCTEKYCTCTGWVIDDRFRAEIVIREAIDKTLELVATIADEIRSLKQSNSGMEAVDGIHSR